MAATNYFVPFAAGANANTLTDAQLAAAGITPLGFQSGLAPSASVNKILKQGTAMAAMLGQLIVDKAGVDANDSQSTATLEGNFILAIAAALANADFGVASGTDTYTLTLTPAPISLQTGNQILVYFVNPNIGNAPTLNVNGLGAKLVIKQQGGLLVPGDLSGFVSLVYDGTYWRFNGLAQSSAGRLINVQIFTSSGTYTPSAGTQFVKVRGCGGGGGGSGTSNPGSGLVSLAAPGTAATCAEGKYTIAQIGASQPVTIGAAGTGGAAAAGSNGGTTALGALLSIPGGVGGGAPLNAQSAPTVNANGATSAAATGAFFSRRGTAPAPSTALNALIGTGAAGGDSLFGAGGYTISANNSGVAASGYGGGGGGTMTSSGSGSTGGNGSPGILIIEEYGV